MELLLPVIISVVVFRTVTVWLCRQAEHSRLGLISSAWRRKARAE
jgi:hypothetical protein